MNAHPIDRFTEVALAAIHESESIALDSFRKPMQVEDKMTGGFFDPVTEADKKIEVLLRARLEAAFPDHRIVGEEYGETGSGDYSWIIDPIDGTRAFITGMPTWGMLIGLCYKDECILGIMHQPFTGETYIGRPDGATLYHRENATPLTVSTTTALDQALVYTTAPAMFLPPDLASRFNTIRERCRLHRWGGDCYSLALLAQGSIDLVVEGVLMPYDIVPMVPIIEAAGGIVTDLGGTTPLNGGLIIAACTKELHEHAMEIMKE